MSSYSELIKNFERIRSYLREFYVYGFKSREEYDKKSARAYDDERRRMESWLGEHMSFVRTPEGKNMFISIDSRVIRQNPFYKAWKAKSFTDGDITLHFLIFDILHTPGEVRSLPEMMEELDRYLSGFETPMVFDESTVRKKLKEYAGEGLITVKKEGRKLLYSRAETVEIETLAEIIDFFSEVAPCGVVGSFLQDREERQPSLFSFKHHYLTQAIDSDIMATLFDAMERKCRVTVDNLSRGTKESKTLDLVPLKIYISAQNGRQHLIAYSLKGQRTVSYRLDYLSNVRIGELCEEFDRLRRILAKEEAHMWGVSCNGYRGKTEHVEFEIRVEDGEHYIVQRMQREKRCGRVEKLDEHRYRFVAEVYNTEEMLPWIRTFLCRITALRFSNRTVENRFKADIREMYRMYGIEGGEDCGIQ